MSNIVIRFYDIAAPYILVSLALCNLISEISKVIFPAAPASHEERSSDLVGEDGASPADAEDGCCCPAINRSPQQGRET